MSKNKLWREAASLLVVARNSRIAGDTTYKMLFQKRSNKSAFMPSNIVFPGGVSDKSDLDPKWIHYLQTFNIPPDKFSCFHKPDSHVPLLFQHESDPNVKHIALRITAIRETFEEVGLLLCKRRNKQNQISTAHPICDFNVGEWQKKVNGNPSEFFSLCEHLDCYPDVWALHSWSNWLTPTTKPQRFNTAFFITFLNTQPNVHIDQREVTEFNWSTPIEVLELFKSKDLVLATPQWYELSKVKIINNFDTLQDYAIARSSYGCELLFPIYHEIKDATIITLPGDSLYPKTPDLANNYKLSLQNKSFNELRDSSDMIHRIVFQDPHDLQCEVKNYISKYREITPCSTGLSATSSL